MGPRIGTYADLITLVGWPDTGAIMRRLDEGKMPSRATCIKTSVPQRQSGRETESLQGLEPVDVRATLDKVAEYFSGVAEDAGVTLAVSGEATVTADPTLVEREVSNLISNGIQHTHAGTTLRITTARHEDSVTIDVENNGAGIPAEQLDRVFDRYFRGDSARSEGAGSGLGLAIVRAIMNLQTAEPTSPALTVPHASA